MSKRPKTAEEYAELVRQTLFEVEQLRYGAEDDMDSMGEALGLLDELETQVRSLWKSMEEGSYEFRDEDLPFMALVEHQSDTLLPFKSLLRRINTTHRQGLDAD
ncbi:MAG TPA: hypothetical protein VKA14_09245 [Gammaproteobacteria bacterium]|nr:hypothetical protein [Gammaproteobacteria bacterium]